MTWTSSIQFVDGWIYAFHMPLFFFLSGLILFRSVEKHWGAFASDRFRKIAYPYVVWSIITVLIKAALGDITNHPYTLSDLNLILYKPIDQFWFLYVLLFLSLIVSALLKLGAKPWLIFVMAVLLYPGVLPISYGWGVLGQASLYAVYLTLGVIVGWGRDLRTISRIHVGWLVIFVGGGLLVTSLGGFSELPYRHALTPVLAISGTAAMVALAALADMAKLDAAIRFLGRYTLEIYVVHTIASAGLRIALLKLAHVSAPAPHLLFGTLAGLYVPIALMLVLDRVGFRIGFILPKSKPAPIPFNSKI